MMTWYKVRHVKPSLGHNEWTILWCRGRNIRENQVIITAADDPAPYGHQLISGNDIYYVGYMSPCHPWGRISITCAIIVWINDVECKYFSICLQNNSTCKGLLTYWGRVTHICVGNQAIIGSDNGLSPGRRQAIIWTNDGILLIRFLEINFGEILSEIHTFSFKKMLLKTTSAKWPPSWLGLNVLRNNIWITAIRLFTSIDSLALNNKCIIFKDFLIH